MCRANVHRHSGSKLAEPTMHLRADRACYAPGVYIGGPQQLLRVQLGDRLADGKRIPHRLVVDPEDRHLARGREIADPGHFAVVAELELHFGKRNVGLRKQDPRPHGPRRVVLVANDQLQFSHDLISPDFKSIFKSALLGTWRQCGRTIPATAAARPAEWE